MPEEIRGLSVKFDADFSEFKKGMKDAEKDINSTQKQLKSLKESLKIDWDSKKFAQAQQQAQKALEATEQKATLLRKRLSEMEAAGVTDKTRNEYNYLEEQLSKTELSAQQLRQQLDQINQIKTDQLTKGLDEATDKLNKAASATRGLSTAAGAAVLGLGAIGLGAVEQADEISTLATQYNMTTDAIQRFNYVALQTDTSSDYLYKGFVKVQAGVADLSQGISSVATKALEQLGLSFEQFDGAEEQFYAIIDSLANMEDQTKMVSLANDIFGERMATNLFPLIYAGTDAISEYREEFEKMGALTEEQVSQLAEFDNVLNDLKTQYKNASLQLGSSLLPVMVTFSEILTEDILPVLKDLIERFDRLDDGTQKWIVGLLMLLAVLSPALRLFGSLSVSISGIIQWLAKMDKSVLSSYAKWGLLLAAVGTLFNVLANWSNMNTTQKIVGLLGSLSAAALAAALAFGVFHSAWSVGLAVAGIVAGIAAATAAVTEASKNIGAEVSFDQESYSGSLELPEYSIPSGTTYENNTTNNNSSYIDNSNIVINIERNEYMTEEEIIDAVNKGLKRAKQSRR